MEAIVKRNGFLPLVNSSFLPTLNPFFDDIISRDIMDWTDKNFSTIGSSLPSVNLKETDKKIEVELAAPGLKKEDFKVEIENNMLSISSEKEEEKEETKKKEIITEKSLTINLSVEPLAFLIMPMKTTLMLIIKTAYFMSKLQKKKEVRKKWLKT